MKKWNEIVKLRFDIVLKSGQRTGGSGGDLDPGATIDSNLAVLRNPANGEPYLPGSSLKGKMRSTLEKELGKPGDSPCNCGLLNCMVCVLFGRHAVGGGNQNNTPPCAPTRMIVRDATLSDHSKAEWQKRIEDGQPAIEEKTENVIRRDSGRAEHPRTGERLLPGTIFGGEIVLHIYEGDRAADFQKQIRHVLKVIEVGSSIGAAGSRGYGEVEFRNLVVETFKLGDLTL